MKTLQATLSYYHNREKSDTKFMVENVAQAIIEAAEQDFGLTLEDIEEVERAIKELEGDEDKKLVLNGNDGLEMRSSTSHGIQQMGIVWTPLRKVTNMLPHG